MNRKIVTALIIVLTLPLLRSNLLAQKPEQGQAAEQADRFPDDLMGDWTLDLESKEPAWMSIVNKDGKPFVYMRIYIGPAGPFEITEVDKGKITFSLKPKRQSKGSKTFTKRTVVAGFEDGILKGEIFHEPNDGSKGKTIPFTGKRIPPMPSSAPDLSKVEFGDRVSLFNGKDLTGWRTHESDKKNGWSAKDGLLINSTPKTDFSPTGAYANLRTVGEFEDFRLHIEFLVEEKRNSGIYLRGMYEAQVVDRDSRMQGLQGVGAIFGRLKPSKNAGLPGGQWQTYDLTLVDRHITVVLNGEKVIDNQPIIGPTAGAIHTDPASPGPIYLQGDHTNVQYRNIYLEPVARSTNQEIVKHFYGAKLLLKRLEPVGMTAQQMKSFNNLSRDLTEHVTQLREKAGIDQAMIKRRDAVYSELKNSDLEADALWNALQSKMEISDAQRDAFRATKQAAAKFRKDALALLTNEQRAKMKKTKKSD